MAGLFGVLDAATRAMAVNQSGLQTVSHNIANVDNPEYTKQRQVIGAAPPRVAPNGLLGRGVEQKSVIRLTDSFLEKTIIDETSTEGSVRVQSGALNGVEEVFNEQQRDGITRELSAFYETFNEIASSPTPGQSVEREAARAQGQTLITTIKRLDSELRVRQREADNAISIEIANVNAIAEQIALLNGSIARQEPIAPANDLRDQRDQLVRDLSRQIDIDTFEQDNGTLTVLVGGGSPLVDELNSYELVGVADPTNSFDTSFVRIYHSDGSSQFDITDRISSGSIGGRLTERDTIVGGAIRKLDTIAFNVVTTVNEVHQLGRGLDGNAHRFFTALSQVENAAFNMSLDADIEANVNNIAAGLTADPGDNENARALADLRISKNAIILPGDPPAPGSGPTRSVFDHVVATVATIGEEARTMQTALDQQEVVMQDLQDRRDSVSGVSLDEEVVDLIRLQTAFQANTRVIATIQSMLDDIARII